MMEARTLPCLQLCLCLTPRQPSLSPPSVHCRRTWTSPTRGLSIQSPEWQRHVTCPQGASAAFTVCGEEGLPAQWWPLVSHMRSNSSSVYVSWTWHCFHWKTWHDATSFCAWIGWFYFQIFVTLPLILFIKIWQVTIFIINCSSCPRNVLYTCYQNMYTWD